MGAIKALLAAALLAWLVRSGRLDGRAFAGLDTRAAPWLALAALLQAAMVATMGARWRAWLALALAGSHAPQSASLGWREALVVAARGACAGVWTPAGLGMDGVRAAHALRRFPNSPERTEAAPEAASEQGVLGRMLARVGSGKGIVRAVAAASLLDRLVALAILCALCLPLAASRLLRLDTGLAASAAVLMALAAGTSLLTWRAGGESRGWTRGAWSAASWTLATHLANVAAMGAALKALEPNLELSRVAALAFELGPAVILSSALPLTPLGLGVADATGEALFAQRGLQCGGEVVMLGRALWLGVCLLAGLAFWIPDRSPDASLQQTGPR